MTDADELFQTLSELREEVFRLAKEEATGSGDAAARMQRAEEINTRFNELQPKIEELPEGERERLYQPLTEGRLDLVYVLSKGEDPTTSTRLYHALGDLEAGGAD